ncbi:cytochrome ubiquinol oxidase subunit I [Actinospica durhamensis]|uniref:Cytochrome ubiquinol oxidase subunit I n=1 Tax=Actinospica durhamensis TaxID=1508375 RepID=A0A941IQH0_9ACTN|nr:cytochrome ubiquinol oxidase subunit I [Actinospica durhamensis]MBR7832918.1 cytochrome ubiquinol oxidase subunit I [Actinospica durhamensis]
MTFSLATSPPLPPVMQAYLLQARQMQAMSFMVHIPLVCFGIAFPALVAFVEWRYLRTGDVLYRTLARRWTRVMVTLFAAGVVTGTVLSFEMGLLWPAFTGTFGSVFGLGFAIEGFSFFLEAIFLGIYVYGWDRLSPRVHFLCALPIVVAGIIGSFMVMSINGWMNHPQGFTVDAQGHVTDVRPLLALYGNTYFWHELVHMYLAGNMVTGFLVAGAYAVGRLRGRWGRYERTALTVPLSAAALAAPMQVVVGDWAARQVATQQPVKLAAIEGLGQSTNGASEHLLGYYTDGHVEYGIAIPHLLSLLAFHSWNATVQGLDIVPAADQPPVNLVRFSFQIMVGVGTLLALLAVVYFLTLWRHRRLPLTRWFYRALAVAGPLSYLALIGGWVTTEVGRQPWVVYMVMRTDAAVTGAGSIPIGYGLLAAAYAVLIVSTLWALHRLAKIPMPADGPPRPTVYPVDGGEQGPLPVTS